MRKLIWLIIFGYHALCAQHKCGNDYFNSLKRLETIRKVFTALAFQPGDTIASIGASNGWFEAALSVYHDSLIFYLEDINENCLNPQELAKEIKLYSDLKKAPIRNKFVQVAGTETSTNLTSGKFKKILLNDVYHHFTDRSVMLKEIARICSANAEISLVEPIGPATKKCSYFQNPDIIVSEFDAAGFKLQAQTEVMNGTFLFRFARK